MTVTTVMAAEGRNRTIQLTTAGCEATGGHVPGCVTCGAKLDEAGLAALLAEAWAEGRVQGVIDAQRTHYDDGIDVNSKLLWLATVAETDTNPYLEEAE